MKLALLLLGISLLPPIAAAAPPERPGHQGAGTVLLPNGWRIAPAGRHITVGDLPLAMVESPDGRYLIVSNNGYAKPTLAVVDVERLLREAPRHARPRLARPGLASGRQAPLLVGGGRRARVRRAAFDAAACSPPAARRSAQAPAPESFVAGVAVSPDGSRAVRRPRPGRAALLDRPRRRGRSVARASTLPAEAYTGARLAGRHARCLRLALGRRARAALRRGHPRAARRDRGGRAPERDGPLQGRRRGCSWPAPTPTRSGWWTSPRGRRASRSRSRSIPARPAGQHAQRPRPLAGRRDAPRGQRGQQRGGRGGRRAARARAR